MPVLKVMSPGEAKAMLTDETKFEQFIGRVNKHKALEGLPPVDKEVVRKEYKLAFKAIDKQKDFVDYGNSQDFDQKEFDKKRRASIKASKRLTQYQQTHNL